MNRPPLCRDSLGFEEIVWLQVQGAQQGRALPQLLGKVRSSLSHFLTFSLLELDIVCLGAIVGTALENEIKLGLTQTGCDLNIFCPNSWITSSFFGNFLFSLIKRAFLSIPSSSHVIV